METSAVTLERNQRASVDARACKEIRGLEDKARKTGSIARATKKSSSCLKRNEPTRDHNDHRLRFVFAAESCDRIDDAEAVDEDVDVEEVVFVEFVKPEEDPAGGAEALVPGASFEDG